LPHWPCFRIILILLAGTIEFVHIEKVSALDKFYCINSIRVGQITAGSRQHSRSWLRVPRNSLLYFTVSRQLLCHLPQSPKQCMCIQYTLGALHYHSKVSTNISVPSGIRNHDLSSAAESSTSLIPRGHRSGQMLRCPTIGGHCLFRETNSCICLYAALHLAETVHGRCSVTPHRTVHRFICSSVLACYGLTSV
jgi:hypothetical protein